MHTDPDNVKLMFKVCDDIEARAVVALYKSNAHASYVPPRRSPAWLYDSDTIQNDGYNNIKHVNTAYKCSSDRISLHQHLCARRCMVAYIVNCCAFRYDPAKDHQVRYGGNRYFAANKREMRIAKQPWSFLNSLTRSLECSLMAATAISHTSVDSAHGRHVSSWDYSCCHLRSTE